MSRIIRPTAPDLIIPHQRVRRPVSKRNERLMAPTFYIAGNERLQGAVAPFVGGDAAQTTAFLARTSGLSVAETNAYKALINGLVSDGTFTLLDILYIFATNTTTTALLNLISTSFTGTWNQGAGSFVADQGFTGDGNVAFIDSGFNPRTAGGQFALNSGSAGVYIRTSDTTGANTHEMASFDSTTYVGCQVKVGANFGYSINTAFGTNSTANANAQGQYVISRTSSSQTFARKNGGAGFTFSNNADTSSAIPSANWICLALNTAGAGVTIWQEAAAFIGGGLTTTQMDGVASRINTYMTAVGANVY